MLTQHPVARVFCMCVCVRACMYIWMDGCLYACVHVYASVRACVLMVAHVYLFIM
jgi:hypothetical protein